MKVNILKQIILILTFCWPCISVINQHDAQNFCFKLSLFHASTFFEHMCSSSGGCLMQFRPPDDEHMCSKHVEAWNKTYCETNFVHQVG